ncbi:MAG: anhydro-N-acetylmuramic acid kinase [Bacteroidia bacterium]|nr:anhydro-N-acetylmuramic acid kinase [Bacteroidia bacterium]
MSGTSMDGVDIAYCLFTNEEGHWDFEIKNATTISYDKNWIVRLTQLYKQPIHLYPKTDVFYGKFLGKITRDFITKNNLAVDFIASHGHTIFHQPKNGFTAQIGCGAAISAACNLPVVNNFRIMDVALNGQGAPLVPIGDQFLFANYDACLNLGGFANISFKNKQKAFDISPCNMAFNLLANELNLPYDEGGHIASSGSINELFLVALNDIDFYKKNNAKSLGIEWFNQSFLPLLNQFENISLANKMATINLHVAQQIANVINLENIDNVLVTGGGAYNKFLIENLKSLTKAQIIIPDSLTINYKEALIFAFLGVLRIRNEINILKSVTGAVSNSIGGALHGNFSHLIEKLKD